MSAQYDELIGNAILGIDTIWGGDVMCASGTGRFIADSWFSGQPLPRAYTVAEAAAVRQSGGVSAKSPDAAAIQAYLTKVDIPAAIAGMKTAAEGFGGLRGDYLAGLALCFEAMWDLAMEILGKGAPVPYERCVMASCGQAPEPSDPVRKRELVAQLLGAATGDRDALLSAVDSWRKQQRVSMASVRLLGAAVIGHFDALTARNILPYLPAELHDVPRANIEFLPITEAWFSGSMNYLGHARRTGGEPEYEASYEINASLEISLPEFLQLVSHEVVPGHVTTFAYLQNLYWRKLVGFEASVLTMNTRAAALFEGIANNAILMAYGVTEVEDLPDTDLQIGVLLALLQDDAKNQSSYLTWGQGKPQSEVAATLRHDFLVSPERADKLSGAWGRHPLLGRMYLPAYRAGTKKVASLRRKHKPEDFLPVLYGACGLVDITTIDKDVDRVTRAGDRRACHEFPPPLRKFAGSPVCPRSTYCPLRLVTIRQRPKKCDNLVLLPSRQTQPPDRLVDVFPNLRCRPASNLFTRIVLTLASPQTIARVIEMHHFLQALQVPVVHVGFDKIRTRPLVGIPQSRRLEFSIEGIRQSPPARIHICGPPQKTADSLIHEAATGRVGNVAVRIGSVLRIIRDR